MHLRLAFSFNKSFTVSTSDMFYLPPTEYFKDKTSFVTGCTGLVGQLLIEKLIRLDVRKIFVLVRNKKGVTPQERITTLFNTPIFARLGENLDQDLNNNTPSLKWTQKIKILEGDLSENGLGMNENDTNSLIEETELIFHAAAHVRFDECLRDCVTINVKGTQELLNMAEKMSNLLSFVYVSTAFSQIHHKIVEEKFYPAPIDPDVMIKALDLFESDELLNIFTHKMISPLVNSYTFSKALAEELIKRRSERLPICVVRPSIILTTYREPISGYTSNLYGISGIICGVGIGILRVANIGPDTLSDIIPADYVTNFILLSAWNQSNCLSNTPVYNCCASENSVFNKYVGDKSVEIGKTMPLKRSLWKICYTAHNFHGFFFIFELFYHILPAFLFDCILILQCKKTKVVKIYRKIAKFQDAVSAFFNVDYKFSNKCMTMLIDKLPEKEREVFECDIRKVVWDDFWPCYIKGLRKYMMKEDDDTIPEALVRHNLITLVHNLILGAIYLQFLYFFVKFLF